MTTTTFRAQLRAGCKTILDTYKAANPTQLAHVYDHNPGSYRTPCAFVATVIDEPSIDLTRATRTRTLLAHVYVINRLISDDQAADEQDALVDGLVAAFTSDTNIRLASAQSRAQAISVSSDRVVDGEATYAASVINVRGEEPAGNH